MTTYQKPHFFSKYIANSANNNKYKIAKNKLISRAKVNDSILVCDVRSTQISEQ